VERQVIELPVSALVRDYFPDATDADVEFILWEKTGWPCFFRGDPVVCIREQLRKYRDARAWGLDTCYGCGEVRQLVDGHIMCAACVARL
jgi:hypothetical protein